jgi:hypothetical protein
LSNEEEERAEEDHFGLRDLSTAKEGQGRNIDAEC